LVAYLAVATCFYNDVNGLERELDSVFLQLPMRYTKAIMIDGIFKGYPDNKPLSYDGSRELIRSYQDRYGEDKIDLYNYPQLHERKKRQKYVDIAAKQQIKFVLILDSDEYVQVKSSVDFLSELRSIEKKWKISNEVQPWHTPRIGNTINVQCLDNVPGMNIDSYQSRPRLWYRPGDMHYTDRHYWWKRKDQVIEKGQNFEMALQYQSLTFSNNLTILHDHSCRSEDREKRRLWYEKEVLPGLEK